MNDMLAPPPIIWKQQSTQGPPPRYGASMARVRDSSFVLFGGIVPTNPAHPFPPPNPFGDTWTTMDGVNWTQQSPQQPIPPARSFASMAQDANGNVVLFGGFDQNSNPLGDTWTWDGSNWTLQSPQQPIPPARGGASIALDFVNGNVVLFGGSTAPGPPSGFPPSGSMLNDTWIWDGSNWTQQSPQQPIPPARCCASMVMAPRSNGVVLFGGVDPGDSPLGDTWTWDGSNWTQQSPQQPIPPARCAASMAIDIPGNLILFGGFAGPSTPLGDTWTFYGGNWTQQSLSPSPLARGGASMYGGRHGLTLLFGGATVLGGALFNDTWRAR